MVVTAVGTNSQAGIIFALLGATAEEHEKANKNASPVAVVEGNQNAHNGELVRQCLLGISSLALCGLTQPCIGAK